MKTHSDYLVKFSFFVIFCFSHSFIHAQQRPTQAEIDKMIKQAEEMKNDPAVKKALQMANGDMLMEDAEGSMLPKKLPVMNVRALASISKTPLTTESVGSYITDVHAKIFKVLSAANKATIQQVIYKVQSNPVALSRSAVMAWYSNSPYVALGLAAEAGKIKNSNAEILNTLASLLSFNGLQQKSIPILTYLNTKIPGNATVLNNLGQAYLALGEITKAEQFLLQCTTALPAHHEANKSLAMIYRAKGQTTKAKQCIQKALEGVHSETAIEIAKDLGIDEEEIDKAIIRPLISIKAPEYFNNYKYQLPSLLENVAEAKKVDAEHRHFRDYLDAEDKKYERLEKEQQVIVEAEAKKLASDAMAGIRNKNVTAYIPPPMLEKAKRMFSYWLLKFNDFGTEVILPEYIKLGNKTYELDQKYHEEYAKINMGTAENKCPLFDNLANRYLPLYAANQRDFIDKFLTPYRGYMDELMYWSQYLNVVKDGRLRTISLIRHYLDELEKLSRQTKIIFPSCEPDGDRSKEELTAGDTEEKDCPIDININLVVGSISMDCEKFSFKANAGISFSAEKNFISKETTLGIGIGLSGDLSLPIPGVSWEGSAGASEQMFIVFDGDNHFQDVGLKMDVSAGVEVGVDAGPLSKDLGDSGISGGYILSLNDGFTFSGGGSGIFKNAFN